MIGLPTMHDVLKGPMPTVIGGNNVYPSLEDVTDLVRSLINDDGSGATGTVGEGQIAVDNPEISPAMLRFLNAAIKELFRELRNIGDPTLIVDNYILLNLPVINGPEGSATPSPETQVSLGYTGCFDGTQMWPGFTLPANMLMPTEIWQRQTGSNLPFTKVPQAEGAIPSAIQGLYMGQWEWRGDAIWFNGAVQACDLRIRGQLTFPAVSGANLDFSTTYIPVQDCVNVVAYKVASKFAMRLGNPTGSQVFDAKAKEETQQLRNEQVRRAQSIDYGRQGYGSGSGLINY